MGIPPSGQRPSSTPSGKGRADDARDNGAKKDFKLPSKKEEVKAKDEEAKKKNLFDIAAQEMATKEKQQNLSQEMKLEGVKVQEVTGAQAVAQVNKVSVLIQNLVETMHIGEVNSKSFAQLQLKQSDEVPKAFAGSQLTVSYQENGLAVHFDHFMSPQQQNTAIALVERNKEQLEGMVQALNAKNIQISELRVGDHVVTLPRVEAPPPPFQAPRSAQAETEQQRREGRGQEEQEREGGP